MSRTTVRPVPHGGSGYRILHIDPALIQRALGTGGLPFVRSPVLEASQLPAGFAAEVWDIDAESDDMARTEIAVAAAGLLARAGGRSRGRSRWRLAGYGACTT